MLPGEFDTKETLDVIAVSCASKVGRNTLKEARKEPAGLTSTTSVSTLLLH